MTIVIVKRSIEDGIKKGLSSYKVAVVLGARQVGKTTLVKSLIQGHPSQVYLSFDDMGLRRRLEEAPDSLKGILEGGFRTPWKEIPEGSFIVLDECQKTPDLMDQIKLLYDENPRRFSWILTGSSSLEIRQKTSESLAGRAFYFYLSPFTWGETFLAHHQIPWGETSFLNALLKGQDDETLFHSLFLKYQQWSEDWLNLLDMSLVFGSYPEVVLTPQEDLRWSLLRNYQQSYLERDVMQLSQVGDWKGFAHVSEVVAHNANGILRISDLSEQTGLARDTVKKYLSILEQSFLVYDLSIFSRQVSRRILKSSKYEWTDLGLVSLLTRATDLKTLQATGAIGTRLENWAINQFYFAAKNRPLPPRLSFWRTTSQAEVDLILEVAGEDHRSRIFPIEIKYTNKIKADDLKWLKALRKERPLEIRNLFIFYRGPYHYLQEEKVHCCPVWGLF